MAVARRCDNPYCRPVAVLTSYFEAEANRGGPDIYSLRQLANHYSPKNKVLMVFISDRFAQLNHLNRIFQGEQTNQLFLLEQLLSFFYYTLDEVITEVGVRYVKASSNPFAIDLTQYRKPLSAVHFG